MKLSVVLATFNEGENIDACLGSVYGWCNEIVIVDGGSTDDTVEKSHKYEAKILVTDNPPIFHINKQKAIELAKSDWVLQLDADERVTQKLKQEIDQAISSGLVDGYWIPRKNFFLGRFLMKGGVYPDYTLRLYRRGKARLPAKDVHEQAIVDGKTGYLINPLIHKSDTNLNRYLIKFNRYTDLIASEIMTAKTPVIFMLPEYMLMKPLSWFFMTYLRHKGFMDSWQGIVFSLLSSLRFPVAYIKFLTKRSK